MAAASSLGDISSAPPIVGYECAARVSSLPPLSQYVLRTPPHSPLALVRHGGAVHALFDVCPHKQAQMSLGDIEDAADGRGLCLKCPRHRKKFPGGLNFDVATGRSWVRSPEACLTRYDETWCLPVFDVQIHGDYVYVSTSPRSGVIPPPRADSDDDAAARAVASTAATSAPATSAAVGAPPAPLHASALRHTQLAAATWRACRILRRQHVTHDSSIYVIAPVTPEPIAMSAADRSSWHVQLRVPTPDGAVIEREYTPLSEMHDWEGAASPVLHLLIKHYPRGALTSRLRGLPDDQLATLPVWVSNAETTLSLPSMLPVAQTALSPTARDAVPSGSVLLVGGGTGVTPILQLLRWCVQHTATDPVFVVMSQHGVDDMLCERELADVVAASRGRAKLLYLLTRGAASGDALIARGEGEHTFQATGRVRAAVLAAFLGRAATLRRVVASGPQGMYDSCVEALVGAGIPSHVAVELEA